MSGLPRSIFAALPGLLAEEGLAALLVVARSARDVDLAPFVGGAHLGESLLLVGADGMARLAAFSPMEREEAASTGLALVTPEDLDLPRLAREAPLPADFLAGAMAALLSQSGIGPSPERPRVALAGHAASGTVHAACSRLAGEGWDFRDGAELLRAARRMKGDAELALIWAAADGTAAAFRAVARLLAGARLDGAGHAWLEGERLRVGRLRSEIRRVLADHGLEQPEGNLVAIGGDAGVPHSQGADERAVRAGEPLLVDLFPHGAMFADCTRVFCLGEPDPAVRHAHATVLAALEWATHNAVAGARGWSLQEGVCGLFKAAGYATPLTDPGTTQGYVHGLGHGVGYELHEQPSFRKETGRDGLLSVSDVFTLEPGLYDPSPEGGYGIRLEDLFWLGPDGLVNLTPLPHSLDPREFVNE